MKKMIEVKRGTLVPNNARWIKDIKRSTATKFRYEMIDVYEVSTVNKPSSEFYLLLKSKVIGRVINGTIDGCLLESELEEIYEQYCDSKD